jgi:hypothetical protein
MDTRELDQSTSGAATYERQGCQVSPGLAESNRGMEMEFDSHVFDWVVSCVVECDDVRAAKKRLKEGLTKV